MSDSGSSSLWWPGHEEEGDGWGCDDASCPCNFAVEEAAALPAPGAGVVGGVAAEDGPWARGPRGVAPRPEPVPEGRCLRGLVRTLLARPREDDAYAVVRASYPGVYLTWPGAARQVIGYPQCIYKKYRSIELAREAFVRHRGKEPRYYW